MLRKEATCYRHLPVLMRFLKTTHKKLLKNIETESEVSANRKETQRKLNAKNKGKNAKRKTL